MGFAFIVVLGLCTALIMRSNLSGAMLVVGAIILAGIIALIGGSRD